MIELLSTHYSRAYSDSSINLQIFRKISEIRKRAKEQKSHHERTMEASGYNIYFVYN